MNFKKFSDKDLKDVFVHLHFTKQCILRRCSRRVQQLLRSEYVLRTMVFQLPLCREKHLRAMKQLLRPGTSYAKNLIFLGRAGRVVRLDDVGVDVLYCFPGPLDRLILHNLTVAGLDMHGPRMLHRFQRVVYSRVTFLGGLTQVYLSWYLEFAHDMRFIMGSKESADFISKKEFDHPRELQVTIVEPYTVYPQLAPDLDFGPECDAQMPIQGKKVGAMLAERMPALSPAEMEVLTGRLRKIGLRELQRQLSVCLKHFQPDFKLPKSKDLRGLDYSLLKPVVCRMLSMWTESR